MASPSALRLRQLQQAAKDAAARAAMQEAALVAGRQRSLPKPRAVPVEGAPMYLEPSAGEVPRGPVGVGTTDTPPLPADDVLRFSEIDPEDVPGMYELLRKLGNEGPNALLPEEVLALTRAGADLDLVMAGPIPQAQVQAILRKVANGLPLTPQEIAGLRRTTGTPEFTGSSTSPSPEVAPAVSGRRPFAQQGAGGPLVGEDGSVVVPLEENTDLFKYPDGTIVDVEGNVVGSAPGDLTDVSSMADDLENSATPIDTDATDPSNNLTPNFVRQNKVDSLAERIRQATARANDEPIAGLARLQKEVTSLSPAELEALRSHPMLAEGIESVAAKRNPEARQAAIANAQARLDSLAQMAEVRASDRAAGQLRAAAAARETAAAPRPAAADGPAAAADVTAARQLLEESLPEGDWNSLTAAFNALPAERKAAVLARMPSSRSLASMLDTSTGEPTFTPNAQAQLSRGVNEVEDALIRLDAAMRSGDEEAITAARDTVMDIQTRPMPEEERTAMLDAAKQSFLQRRQTASELRNAIIGTDPMYVSEQERALGAAVLPAPRPGIAPGSRTPIVATGEVERADMPSALDEAVAVARDREEMLGKRVAGGGLTEAQRKLIFEGKTTPLAFKGDDTANPLEVRPSRERLPDTDDENAIRAAQEADANLKAALEEMQKAEGAPALARAQKKVEEAQRAIDKAYPPRLVHQATGRVRSVPRGMTSADVPKGWVMERGRAARPDSSLARESIQSVRDNFILTVVGGRPKVESNIDRASVDLSPSERAVMNDDMRRSLGESFATDDVIPESPDDDIVPLGKQGKRGRMGSTQQQSRVQGALRGLYGTHNPLGLATPGEGPELGPFPVFRTAEEAADDLLAGQTVFKPGTASYDYAREKLANAINDYYGPNSLNTSSRSATGQQLAQEQNVGMPVANDGVRSGTTQSPSQVPVVQNTWPEGSMRQLAASGPGPARTNTAGAAPTPERDPYVSAADSPDLSKFPSRRRSQSVTSADLEAERFPDEDGKPIRGNKPSGRRKPATAEDAKLDASDTDITDMTGDPTPSAPGNRDEILAEIDQEGQAVFDQTYRNYLDMGESEDEAKAYARDASSKYIEEQRQARIKPMAGDPSPADAAPAKPAGRGRGGKRKNTQQPADADSGATQQSASSSDQIDTASGDGSRPVTLADEDQMDLPAAADDGPKTEPSADGKPQQPAAPAKKQGWSRTAKIAAGTTLVGGGLGILARLNSGGGSGTIDIPIPPGGGGGGGGPGSGDFYPIPVNTDGASLMDGTLSQEAAIKRALDRIRGARASGPQTYQTLQNYTIGR